MKRLALSVIGISLIFMAGSMVQSASAVPAKWSVVPLGSHRFGHLGAPDAIVARAGPKEVGFWKPPSGQGSTWGPWSFEVAPDGSIWLLDEVNNRLLVWRAGRPGQPAWTVRLPKLPFEPADFALGPNGTIYLTSPHPREALHESHMDLYALTPSGHVRWKAPVFTDVLNATLRMGADGTLYSQGSELGWVPLTTPAGQPLTVPEQRRRARSDQLLPGGLRLVADVNSRHEQRFSLMDQADRVLGAWRVTSATEIWPMEATPALMGRDLVVALDVTDFSKPKHLFEHMVLRLSANGTPRPPIALDAHAVWGSDWITRLRVGPDGHLYELRTSPNVGVSIARYSLGAPQRAPATPTPSAAAVPSPGPTVSQPAVVPPPLTMPASQSAGNRVIGIWLAGVSTAALVALGALRLHRRRRGIGSSSLQ